MKKKLEKISSYETLGPDFIMKKELINLATNNLMNQIDDLIIEGLSKKGFFFVKKTDLHDFIKNNCRCEERIHKKERIYFVNDIPFLAHIYEIDLDFNKITLHEPITFKANYGSFKFL